MSHPNAVVAIFDSHRHTEAAVLDLQNNGFDLNNISIIGREQVIDQPLPGTDPFGREVLQAAKKGAIWGGLGGLVLSVGLFSLPGVGPLLIAGPLLGAMAVVMEGAAVVGGLSALGAVLVNVGIYDAHHEIYENAIKAGHLLLIYHCAGDEVKKVRQVLEQSHATAIREYQDERTTVNDA